ncbi:hypothetical protein GF376_03410 [Candidatus Peregrinibacteria bacterium]|nr:hypothetical protein [Candidatus Peregrinibacteria bacterium]
MNKFDGQLVVLADQDIIDDDSISVRLANDSFVSENDTQLLNLIEASGFSRRSEIDKLYFDRLRDDADDKEILELATQGRLKMAILLATKGGKIKIADRIRNVAERIKHNGGKVEAFVPTSTCSSGAMIMQSGQEIFTVGDSHIGWHLSSFALNGNDSDRLSEMASIKKFVSERAYPEFIKPVLRHFETAEQDISNKDNFVMLQGYQMGKYGLATEVFYSTGRLKSYFEHEYVGMTEDAKEIEDFWNVEIFLEDYLRNQYSSERSKIHDIDIIREAVRIKVTMDVSALM